MNQFNPPTNKQMKKDSKLNLSRWLVRGGVIPLFLGTLLLMNACLPASYTMQIKEVVNCGESPLSDGIFDVATSDSYRMTVSVYNWLTMTANPSTFAPESNYIELRKAKIWFTYPASFSLPKADALYLETNPREVLVYGRLEPTIQGTFEGTGGTGNSTASASFIRVSFRLIPSETARLWASAPELKTSTSKSKIPATLGSHFIVIANVVLYGQSGTGTELSTPVLKFPISVCRSCLDNSAGDKIICQSGGTSGGSVSCVGQDGFCYEKPTGNGAGGG